MKKTNYIIVTGLFIAGCSFLLAFNHTGVPENKKKPVKYEADISDLVLIYHGSTHRLAWDENEIRPYIYTENQTGFHWLFDGFIFLEIFDNIRGYEWDPGFKFKTAAKD